MAPLPLGSDGSSPHYCQPPLQGCNTTAKKICSCVYGHQTRIVARFGIQHNHAAPLGDNTMAIQFTTTLIPSWSAWMSHRLRRAQIHTAQIADKVPVYHKAIERWPANRSRCHRIPLPEITNYRLDGPDHRIHHRHHRHHRHHPVAREDGPH